jgi:hypothetical protein
MTAVTHGHDGVGFPVGLDRSHASPPVARAASVCSAAFSLSSPTRPSRGRIGEEAAAFLASEIPGMTHLLEQRARPEFRVVEAAVQRFHDVEHDVGRRAKAVPSGGWRRASSSSRCLPARPGPHRLSRTASTTRSHCLRSLMSWSAGRASDDNLPRAASRSRLLATVATPRSTYSGLMSRMITE